MASEKEKRIVYERQREEKRQRAVEAERWAIKNKRRGEMHQADLRAKRLKNQQAQLAFDRAAAAVRKRDQAEKKKAKANLSKAKVMKPKPVVVAPIPPKKPDHLFYNQQQYLILNLLDQIYELLSVAASLL